MIFISDEGHNQKDEKRKEQNTTMETTKRSKSKFKLNLIPVDEIIKIYFRYGVHLLPIGEIKKTVFRK